jgi:16S rRNA (cytidine1402-2'-O)-methyltransferase
MEKGKLYIIATPIGNLEDITLRAIKTLREDTDYIFCEDTRQTRKILMHFGIELPTLSLHSHSSLSRISRAIKIMCEGKNVSYLTDSGTPALSDPGSKLVSYARENGIAVIPIPGASALSTIISVSGFSEKNIIFAGFLSKKEGRRRRELERLSEYNGTIVIYESPHRIKKLLTAIHEIFPHSEIIIGREMTKIHEEFLVGRVEEIYAVIDNIKERGEFTIAVFNRK